MMKQWTLALLAASVMAMPAAAVQAGDHHGGDGKWSEMREKFKEMTPEERKAFFEKKKAEWEGMSKEEKLKKIEERRAERIKHREEKWNGMNDDEKIAYVEKKMKRMHEHHEKMRDCVHEDKEETTTPAED